MKNNIHHWVILTNLIHIVSSGCVLHTFGNSVSEINCENMNSLEKMRQLRSDGILTINVTNSELTTLSSEGFEDFRDLARILLSGNSIETIDYGVFSSETTYTMFPFLMVLDLSENNLETLPSEIFNHSVVLELNLSSNSLENMEIGAFRNMPKLKKLDLSFNHISSPDEESTLPLGVFQDINTLDQLNLSYNALKTIKIGTFSMLPFLFVLDLSHNELTHLPGGVFVGSAIHELYLNDNKLVFFEYLNTKSIHPVINLINNDFECNDLATSMSKIPNAFFKKGNVLIETNIYGIACREDGDEEEEDGDDGILEQVYILKYLSIATFCLGLILAGYVFFCQRDTDDEDDDDEPVLKEISPLH